jgi:MFS transporter, FSR family, fosmidomycin resistance protein
MVSLARRRARPLALFVLTLLIIELLDEIVFGVREAAWPLIRTDLGLNYVQIGIILSLPTIVGNVVEPALGILGDVWRRRVLIVAGGMGFTLALVLVGVSQSFYLLLLAFILFSPSSGAFVGLSQAALMDYEPERHEQNMARWSFAGSLGQLVGPLLLGTVIVVGGGWRSVYLSLAALALVLVVVMFRSPLKRAETDAEKPDGFIEGVKKAISALRRR